jgi:hypothetical protein
LDSLDRIKVHMVATLNAKKSYVRRKNGEHTVEVYEEGTRAEDTGSEGAGSLLNVISHRVTGSRSNNVSILLLTNSLSMFDSPRAKAIKSNITSYIVGKIDDSDLKSLREDFHCEDIANYIERISFSGDAKLKNAFAALIDTGKTKDKALFKIRIPDSIERRLRTRDVVSYRKTAPSQ